MDKPKWEHNGLGYQCAWPDKTAAYIGARTEKHRGVEKTTHWCRVVVPRAVEGWNAVRETSVKFQGGFETIGKAQAWAAFMVGSLSEEPQPTRHRPVSGTWQICDITGTLIRKE